MDSCPHCTSQAIHRSPIYGKGCMGMVRLCECMNCHQQWEEWFQYPTEEVILPRLEEEAVPTSSEKTSKFDPEKDMFCLLWF